jgi:glycosyltransferase involved in cell wall biosynthesis
MKLFEYMACMRPVVASNHGQMSDIINDGENGLLCENKPEEILAKLLFLRDNPQKAHEIARKGWELVQREYNWPHNVAETLALFEQVLLPAK